MFGLSCGPPEELNEEEVRSEVDPLVEELMQGIDQCCFDDYFYNLYPRRRWSVNRQSFEEFCALVDTEIGDYKSKEYLMMGRDQRFIDVYYNVYFTKYMEAIVLKTTLIDYDDRFYAVGFIMNHPALSCGV
jgi:hypothetical protein